MLCCFGGGIFFFLFIHLFVALPEHFPCHPVPCRSILIKAQKKIIFWIMMKTMTLANREMKVKGMEESAIEQEGGRRRESLSLLLLNLTKGDDLNYE